jgi:hypothetical protein
MTTPYDIKITPSPDGESLFEAYHSVFSWLTSTEDIYRELAKLCGSNFVYSNEIDIVNQHSDTIFCKDAESTHYMFYKHSTREIFNPYMYFQLYNTHGNCFGYALYLSSIYTGVNPNNNMLINIFGLLEEKVYRGNKYMKVKNDKKQLAYKCFVYNDFIIINWIINLINSNSYILNAYNYEWNSISVKEKKLHDIPVKKTYTFDIYFYQFTDLAKDINNTFTMTLDQITNWDVEKFNLPPDENSGIENSYEIDINNYNLNAREINVLPKMGGKYKKSRQDKKTRHHKKSKQHKKTNKKLIKN